MGKLIAIEGIDGAGKGTQSALLHGWFEKKDIRSALLSFPMYDRTFFGREVGRYLNREFGDLSAIHPKLAAILYAGDRFEAKAAIRELVRNTEYLICDRYVPSNMAHQAARVASEEVETFHDWIEEMEYTVFGVPEPALIILLNVTVEVAQMRIAAKAPRMYTKRRHDLHESDNAYLEAVRSAYRKLAQRRNWITIECVDGGALRGPDDIHRELIRRLYQFFGIAKDGIET